MGEDLAQDTIHLLEKEDLHIFDPIGMLPPLTIILKVMLK